MGDVARCSLGKSGEFYSEDLLYKLFGVNAELLIDHAWGWENCTMADIKAYRPESNSLSSGQVLQCPYDFKKGRLVLREMADSLAMDLLSKGLVTDQITVTIGYDRENLRDPGRIAAFAGTLTADYYGRIVPKHAHGTKRLSGPTSSVREITEAAVEIYERTVGRELLVRRLNITAENVAPEPRTAKITGGEQMDLFSLAGPEPDSSNEAVLARERKRQEAVLAIRQRYGKNAILKGMDLEEGATAMERNEQIGGHRA